MSTFDDFSIRLPAGASGEVRVLCPDCTPKRKKQNLRDLAVNVEKGTWFCHHCGFAGGLREGRDREEIQPKKVWRKPQPIPQTTLPRSVVEYFEKRSIPESVLKRNRITFDDAVYFREAGGDRPAVGFPYFRGGELVNVKWRAREKAFRLEAGAERTLYGLDDVDPTDALVWCEGEIDKLSLDTVGIMKSVSVPDGAPNPGAKNYTSKFAFLESAEETLAKVPSHILAVDADDPGRALEDELARRLGREKCSRVTWPDGCKDANEVLVKLGRGALLQALANARPYPLEGVFEILDRGDNVRALYQQGFERGHATGWERIDQLYTVRPGEFTVVTGIPSSGKSNWLDCLLVNLAERHGWNFGIFSPENLPLEEHMAAIIEKHVGRPFHRGPTPRMSEDELDAGMAWAQEHFAWILPPKEDNWRIENILESARQLCFRRGIRGLVIDPWNELESQRPPQMSETEYISHALKRARVFARQNGIHLWIVVHPAKLLRGKDGEFPIPTLYDCSGSAHWRNKADNGIVVWRDLTQEDAPAVQIHVQKIRFRQIGKRGMAELYYEPACATYSEHYDGREPTPREQYP